MYSGMVTSQQFQFPQVASPPMSTKPAVSPQAGQPPDRRSSAPSAGSHGMYPDLALGRVGTSRHGSAIIGAHYNEMIANYREGRPPSSSSSASRSRSRSSGEGSRPRSREGVPGVRDRSRSLSPIAVRAAQANEILARGSIMSSSKESEPKSQQIAEDAKRLTMLGAMGMEQKMPTLKTTTHGSNERSEFIVHDRFPLREPRHNIDQSEASEGAAGRRRSPEPGIGAAHAIPASPLPGHLKGNVDDDYSSGNHPMRIESSAPMNTTPERSRSPPKGGTGTAQFRPLTSPPRFDPEPGISRAHSPMRSPKRSLSPPKRSVSPPGGRAAALLRQLPTNVPLADPRDLALITKDATGPTAGVQKRGRPMLASDINGRPQSVPTPLPGLGDDVFGGVSSTRRGHRDCTPPPDPFKEANDHLRPRSSPTPQPGASLLPLQQRKSRWIGHSNNSQQPKLLTKSLAHLGEDVESSGATNALLASTAVARTSDSDAKLPKLSPDGSSQAASTRPLGRAKTTGKLLTHSTTAGVLSSYKAHDSRKLFLLKGVPAQRPGTPTAPA